jgi:lycopene cyclase domain-containing protein
MTYFGYLLRFIVVPLGVLIAISVWDGKRGKSNAGFHDGRAVLAGMGLIGLMALVYTTPWDNYLVASGVWSYRAGLVSGWLIGWVPLEEYLFFLLETLLTGAWWQVIARRIQVSRSFAPSLSLRYASMISLGIAWLASIALLFSGWPHGRYLGLILAWALPVLAMQFAFGADILWQSRRLVALTVLPIAAYLSATDTLAIVSGTWSINPALSTGILIGQLPLEEALFFLVTALIVACGLTLFLSEVSSRRWRSTILAKISMGFRRQAREVRFKPESER